LLIHAIFQRHGIPPHEVYNAPRGSRAFMYASMLLAFEEEEKARQQAERR
jgi:hypothetical protein